MVLLNISFDFICIRLIRFWKETRWSFGLLKINSMLVTITNTISFLFRFLFGFSSRIVLPAVILSLYALVVMPVCVSVAKKSTYTRTILYSGWTPGKKIRLFLNVLFLIQQCILKEIFEVKLYLFSFTVKMQTEAVTHFSLIWIRSQYSLFCNFFSCIEYYCKKLTVRIFSNGSKYYLCFCRLVLSAMVISSFGGKILNRTVADFPEVAAYQPVINGVAGNLVSVQVRICLDEVTHFQFNLLII